MHEEKGLALCAEFFHTCGEAMLGRDFAAQRHRIAAGLCGEGSECFGFDDAVSRDHDFGPRFFLFLTEEDNASFGYALARAYAALPQEFHGVRRLAANTVGAPRGGVLTIPAFYRRFTGCPGVPPENLAWLAVPEYALACAVSGAVFSDPLGEFSKIRAQLAKGYPEDVRRKKTAARAIEMAQAGQYNYMRCIRHGEAGAARMALHAFCEAARSSFGKRSSKHPQSMQRTDSTAIPTSTGRRLPPENAAVIFKAACASIQGQSAPVRK